MNKVLQQANLIIRKSKPCDKKENLITVFRREDFLQLTFQTSGCNFSAKGTCSMCNYGHGTMVDSESIMEELHCICNAENIYGVNSVLLGASGSFLDSNELPDNVQQKILSYFSKSSIQNIIIETHYTSISEKKLCMIRNFFPNKHVELEVGLETINEQFQENILNKIILLEELNKKIKQIHSFQMTITVNILLGLPFLSERMQIDDTKSAVKWALDNNVDYIIIFPINIQPYTLFEWWYKKGYFQPVSAWLLVFLLNELTDNEMNHLSISWYGNRSITYPEGKTTITPRSCPKCQMELQTFFDDFSTKKSIRYRRKRLEQLLFMDLPCNCREDILTKIKLQQDKNCTYNINGIFKATERMVNSNGNI